MAGERCQQLNINITNKSEAEIKITAVDYFDPQQRQWRNEARIEQILANNAQWQWRRSLEQVRDATTRLRITYQTRLTGLHLNNYSAKRTAESAPFTCTNNGDSPLIELR
jgi:hypothetical protein